MRRLWWSILLSSTVVAVALWAPDEIARRARTSRPNDEPSSAQPDSPWLIAVDAAGRRLYPSVEWEDGLYVIRCPGYATEAYLPRAGDERPVKITLRPGGTLRGRVVLGDEDHPAAGVRVEVWEWPGLHATRTDQDGRFELSDLGPAGTGTLFPDVNVPGFLIPEVICQAGDVVLVVMGEGEVLRGKVVDPDGAPVAGMPVLLRGHFQHGLDIDGESFSVRSGPDGAFEFRGLGGPEYSVVARDRTRKGVSRIGFIEDYGDRTCVVVVSERPRLRVRVIAPDGTPVEDVLVTTEKELESEFPRDFHRVASGVYVSGPLSLGTQALVISVDGWPERLLKVQLDRVEEREIEVRLKDAHTLRGLVVDDTGRPIEDAWVWLETATAITDADGRFVVRGLPAGPEELTIEHDGHNPVSVTVAPSNTEHRITLPRTATLTGRLEPIPELREVDCRLFSTEYDSADARVDVFGRFAVHGLPTGTEFDITFEIEDWIGVPLRGVTLAPGEVRDVGVLRPPPGATLEGVVRDNYGQELRGVSMSLKSRMQEVRDRELTDKHGVYRFAGLAAVTAELEVYGTGLVGRTFELKLGDRQVMDIVMVRSGLLAGTAKGAAELRLVPVNGGQPMGWEPEEGGRFSVNAAPGHYRLQYRLGDSWITADLVDVVEGEMTRIAVAVPDR